MLKILVIAIPIAIGMSVFFALLPNKITACHSDTFFISDAKHSINVFINTINRNLDLLRNYYVVPRSNYVVLRIS
jgi:hypothetical protein